jgi:catechol 2,3-dioxygenase-like lactoylglutathione lyase family enzyme
MEHGKVEIAAEILLSHQSGVREGFTGADNGAVARFQKLHVCCLADLRTYVHNSPLSSSVTGWGARRMIFYVAEVDAFWEYLRGKGLLPERPRDARWGERYFHMPDPDGYELSFACPI